MKAGKAVSMRRELRFRAAKTITNLCVTLHVRLEHDLQVAELAVACHRSGDLSAALGLRSYLEGRHAEIIEMICRLTDSEADSVEPAFTLLEHALVTLNSLQPERQCKPFLVK